MYKLKKLIPEFIMILTVILSSILIYKRRIGIAAFALIILIGYFFYTFGKRKPIKSVKAELIEDDYVTNMVKELSEEIGVKEPIIMEGNMGNLNAFAVGRKGAGTIVISEQMPHVLDEDELKAVLLHEMSHLKSHDTVIMTVSSAAGYIINYIGFQFKGNVLGFPFYIFFSKVIYNITEIPFLYISRKREYRADRDSAKINGRKPMINALLKVSRVNREIDSDNINRSARQICILGLKDKHKSRIKRFFSTHPSLENRIDYIKKTNKE